MATPTQIKRRGRLSLILGTLLATLTMTAIAFADVPEADGDGVAPIADSDMAFGSVACDVATSKTALIAISRNGAAGSTNVFKNDSTVTVSVLSVSGAGLSATMGSPNTISIPSNWGAQPNNTLSAAVSSNVTIDSTTPGPGSGTVVYRATGVNSSNATINRDDTMNVSWTTGSCAPPDTTAPTTVANGGGYTFGDWTNTNVSVTLTASDNAGGSGVKNITYSLSGATTAGPTTVSGSSAGPIVISNEGTTTITYFATDNSNNVESSKSAIVKIDKTAPGITLFSRLPAANAFGWNNTDVTVTWTCSDGLSGPAVASVADTVSAEGAAQSASGTCYDLAGNSTAASLGNINIDKSAPSGVSTTLSRGPDHNGWYNAPVGWSTTGSDSLSGIASCSSGTYSAPDGTGLTVSGTCTDKAANTSAAASSAPFDFDDTNPSLNANVTPNPVVLNGSAIASAGASDLTSGIASSSCGALALDSVGANKTVTCNASDNAGNTASASALYSVVYATGDCLGAPGRTILQPINSDGTSVFKQGSTVPAKFRVCDANGISIGTTGVVSSFKLVRKVSGLSDEAVDEPVISTTPDSAFRWSATDQQWIYNMSTKNLTRNTTYYYEVVLNDGTKIEFSFGLK